MEPSVRPDSRGWRPTAAERKAVEVAVNWLMKRGMVRPDVIDTDDLRQEMLIALWRKPATTPQMMHMRCRWAGIDYLRLIYGRRGTGVQITYVDELHLPVDDAAVDPFNWIAACELASSMDEKTGEFIELLINHSQREVGEILGLSESRICQKVAELKAMLVKSGGIMYKHIEPAQVDEPEPAQPLSGDPERDDILAESMASMRLYQEMMA